MIPSWPDILDRVTRARIAVESGAETAGALTTEAATAIALKASEFSPDEPVRRLLNQSTDVLRKTILLPDDEQKVRWIHLVEGTLHACRRFSLE